jgi:hypothetical protein
LLAAVLHPVEVSGNRFDPMWRGIAYLVLQTWNCRLGIAAVRPEKDLLIKVMA